MHVPPAAVGGALVPFVAVLVWAWGPGTLSTEGVAALCGLLVAVLLALGCWAGAGVGAGSAARAKTGLGKGPAPAGSPGGGVRATAAAAGAQLRAQFGALSAAVRDGSIGPFRPAQAQQLRLYALFKQATVGVCTARRPSALDMVGAAKWDAWQQVAGMSEAAAMQSYMALVSEVQEAAGGGDSGERGGADGSDDEAPSGLGAVGLMGGNAAAGDWYTEEEPLQGSVGEETGGGAVGVELRSLARDGKLVEVQQLLDAERERGAEAAAASDAAAVIDGVDEAGRTALIWAADRGHAKVVACLLRHGAAVDIQAVAVHAKRRLTRPGWLRSEFSDVVEQLLLAGADADVADNDGETARGWAQEMLEAGSTIRELFVNTSE